MGFLSDLGKTFTFEESKNIQALIKIYGINQFVRILQKKQKLKTLQEDIKWGYELEAHLTKLKPYQKQVKITIDNEKLFKEIKEENTGIDAHVEYGAWMIELIPTKAIS